MIPRARLSPQINGASHSALGGDVVAQNRKSVAVVDDDENVLDATSIFLDSMGFDALPFSSGEDFLRSPDKANVDCLLTDVNMPGMSGLELQDAVRGLLPDLPVIIMSAVSDESVRRRALANGAKEVLQKPILGDVLVKVLTDN
jgi:FixJ family two-component response regulator